MTIYSSVSKRGFYDDAIHTPEQIPEDAVEIPKEHHQALLAGQSAGKLIDFDNHDNGVPVLSDHPKPSRDQQIVRLKAERAELFKSLDDAERIANRRKDKARITEVQTEAERLCDLPTTTWAKLSDDELAEYHVTLQIKV